MTNSASAMPALPRAAGAVACLVLALMLSACADINDTFTTVFADPAQYELYDCKQLEAVRKNLTTRAAELQGLMAKAETGTGGVVVSELAYRNDYLAVRGQAHFADEAWRKNHCRESPPAPADADKPGAATPPVVKPAPPASRSGSAVY